MFAVSSVDAAKLYYETLNALQVESEKPLKIATISRLQPTKSKMQSGTFRTRALMCQQ